MTDFDGDVPLTTRGVPRTRFNPLRDAPGAEKPVLGPNFPDFEPQEADFEPEPAISAAEALILTVKRQISALGLTDTVEGAAAIVAAEKAADATGSAAAACLHELRMAMNEIRASKPGEAKGDPTEDVLSRRRERRGTA
jgi:hypothetical protein